MSRALIIISETASVVTDLNDCFIELDELVGMALRAVRRIRRTFRRNIPTLAKNRIERVLGEDVFDVGDEQFLMLLLVVDAKGQNRFDLAKQFLVRVGNELVDVRVDRRAVPFRLINGGTRDQPSKIAPMHRAGGVVVGIEKISVFWDSVAITW